MRGILLMIYAIFAGVTVGWLSAVAMIENYGTQIVANTLHWEERHSIVDSFAVPYSLSYFVNQGQLPPIGIARHFTRTLDDEGNGLLGNCYYVLNGKIPSARYFTLELSRGDGSRVALGASQMVSESDGSFSLALAPYPVAGNRLQSITSGGQSIALTIHEPNLPEGVATPELPKLTMVRC